MSGNTMLLIPLVAIWLCSMTVFGVSAPAGPLRNHITGGFKQSSYRNPLSDLDCSQFSSDYDILYRFPFQIMVNPMNNDWRSSTAQMSNSEDAVNQLYLRDEDLVPLSIFCLKNLQYLQINNVSFPEGIVPDGLGNLRQLYSLSIYESPIVNVTEQLGSLRNLNNLSLQNCNLTDLPDFSGIPNLGYVDFSNNLLSKVSGLTGVHNLYLSYNLFTDIPTLKGSTNLYRLVMNNNPVKNMLTITSHTNLQHLDLQNTNLSSIPHTIDKLQKLENLYLSNNRLFFLPTNILNLPKLRTLNIQNNLFSSSDILTFQGRFNTSNPNMTLYV